MRKTKTFPLATLILLTGFISTAQASESSVEVRLIADLDDARGYCLDVAGGQGASAPIERGLQAHTCYDYTGSILEDQAFDSALIEQGQLKIPYFDVCMTASSIEVDATLMLAECTEMETQQFSLSESGHLTLMSDPSLCVTASSSEKKEGRGGEPVHVMRPVSLQSCDDDSKDYQSWTTYSME